jgi:hypothetical protein
MAINKENVKIDGLNLVKWSSTSNVKIKSDDGNIYPVAYTAKNSTVQFTETNIPLNEITAGVIVDCKDVVGLSGYISSVVDLIVDD